jgi:hypothetical protein
MTYATLKIRMVQKGYCTFHYVAVCAIIVIAVVGCSYEEGEGY